MGGSPNQSGYVDLVLEFVRGLQVKEQSSNTWEMFVRAGFEKHSLEAGFGTFFFFFTKFLLIF